MPRHGMRRGRRSARGSRRGRGSRRSTVVQKGRPPTPAITVDPVESTRPAGRRGRRVQIHPAIVEDYISRSIAFDPREPANLSDFDYNLNDSESDEFNVPPNSLSDALSDVSNNVGEMSNQYGKMSNEVQELRESVDTLTKNVDKFIKEAYYYRMISIGSMIVVILCGIAIFLINRFVICPDS